MYAYKYVREYGQIHMYMKKCVVAVRWLHGAQLYAIFGKHIF